MEKPWYRKLFDESPKLPVLSIQARAESGDADAQFSLAVMLASARDHDRDYPQAIHWYTKAAEQQHAVAQLNLGIMYAQGQGVARDDARAAVWITRSAEQGDVGAQFNLGLRWQRSSLDDSQSSAAESRIESYKWLQLAASQGHQQAAATWEQVTLRMSREDIKEGNNRIAAFRAVHPPLPVHDNENRTSR